MAEKKINNRHCGTCGSLKNTICTFCGSIWKTGSYKRCPYCNSIDIEEGECDNCEGK